MIGIKRKISPLPIAAPAACDSWAMPWRVRRKYTSIQCQGARPYRKATPRSGTRAALQQSCSASGPERGWLTLRPAKFSRGRAEHLTEMARQIALVGEACCDGDFRQCEIGARQHVLGTFDAPLYKVVVRRDTGRLLELSCEVKH